MEGNWLTTNLKNCVHQQKKASNKSTKFLINRKSVSTSQATSIRISIENKQRTRFLLAETRFFQNNGLPLVAIMISKKMRMKECRFH